MRRQARDLRFDPGCNDDAGGALRLGARLLRRLLGKRPPDEIVAVDLAPPPAALSVRWREVDLTATEWQIVDYLARNEGRLITHRQLITAVWGPTYTPNPNLLRVHMTNIRRKLEQHAGAPAHFITDSGVGYRFENGSAAIPAAAAGRA